jgi:NAD(P)-dependent dehydrogenase (short-subunit alcohol dehydrogenase family)
MSLGPNVFVTGASRGIGLGLVKKLVDHQDVKKIFAGARKPEEANVREFSRSLLRRLLFRIFKIW